LAALAVALAFGASVALAGAGWSNRARTEPQPTALASTACLALLIVLAVDATTLWGHSLWAFMVLALAIAGSGWIAGLGLRGSRGNPPGQRLPLEAIVIGVVGLGLALLMLTFPVPLDTDAQGFGYLALTIRDGGTLTTLAPWHPEIAYLYSPGALLLFAALSQLLPSAPMSSVMMGASGATALLFIGLAWDFGGEIGLQEFAVNNAAEDRSVTQRRWRWATGLGAAVSIGLWTALVDSHFTAIFGLLFGLGCLTSFLRYKRTGRLIDAALSAVCLAGVAVTHPDMTIALGLGLAAFLALGWLAVDRSSLRRWLVMAAIPMGAAVAVSPWLILIRPLLDSGVRSPFEVDLSHAWVLLAYHGIVGPALALAGAALVIRRRAAWGLAVVGWWAMAIDLSTFGLIERAIPSLSESLFRFNYPFSLAWHAPIIPVMALTAAALVWAAGRWRVARFERWLASLACVGVAVALLGFAFRNPLLEATRSLLRFQGSLASANDVLAMRWLRDHTPSGTRVLNYPGDYENGRDWEAQWAPVISERNCVYFRWQPFFTAMDPQDRAIESLWEEQRALLDFWRDPADPANADLLREADIRYVLVPESVGDTESLARAWRWAPPALLPEARSSPSDADYLQPAFSAGGAQVYRTVP
jgi:hypothetical protein